MQGYDATSYGRGFADVYDDWYADVTDVDATVRAIRALAPDGDVLELGVGTGRLAVPMAVAGLRVTGIDSSVDMLHQLSMRDPEQRVDAICGDMVDDLPDADFDVVLVAYNTLFNLVDERAQRSCFAQVARRLRPGGHFVVETFVPDLHDDDAEDAVSVRSITVDRVVLSVSQSRPGDQRALGQFIELSESKGVRLRPWSIRWATLDEMDEMAAAAGLHLAVRWSDMAGTAFQPGDPQQVSVYRRPSGATT